MKTILLNKKYLTACIVLALMLCFAQVMGYTLPIMACLVMFLALAGWSCCFDFTFPVLLFFLPWSPVLRLSPTSNSFYTFALVLICLISLFKNRFSFKSYQIKAGIMLLIVTLVSKILDGGTLNFYYIAFVMMIVLFPSVKEEWKKEKYDFYQLVVFFALGVILASLCALVFADYPGIRRFIRVDAYLTIIRRSGFYGDANFYTAQILAAMGGVLALFLHENKKGRMLFLGLILLFLIYCGFLSASKSFVLVAFLMLILWVGAVMKMQGKAGLKITLMVFLLAVLVFVATSTLFSSLISVLITRFAYTHDFHSFTTGRSGLWLNYLKSFFSDAKFFFLGKGYTPVKIDGRASHNTAIQLFYQFGLVGVPIMIYWIVCFFREEKQIWAKPEKRDFKRLLVFIGAFIPWTAIDILFFDEFFLLQWYMIVALDYFRPHDKITEAGLDGGELWTKR